MFIWSSFFLYSIYGLTVFGPLSAFLFFATEHYSRKIAKILCVSSLIGGFAFFHAYMLYTTGISSTKIDGIFDIKVGQKADENQLLVRDGDADHYVFSQESQKKHPNVKAFVRADEETNEIYSISISIEFDSSEALNEMEDTIEGRMLDKYKVKAYGSGIDFDDGDTYVIIYDSFVNSKLSIYVSNRAIIQKRNRRAYESEKSKSSDIVGRIMSN